jgi:hypothetical protein
MAHSRRAESSYEEHIEDCFDNRRSVLEEEQRTLQSEQDSEVAGEGGAEKQPMFEAFALRCRWGRVDCLVGEGIVTILCGHIAVGAALRFADSQIDHESCSRVRDKEKDSASGLALQAASISLEILYSICRLCDKDQLTSVTLQIMKIWQSCSPLLQDTDDYVDSGFSLQRSQRGGLCCGWWKVVAEMCRRSRHFALWLCDAGPDCIIAKCLILVLRSTNEALPMPVEVALDSVRDVQTVSTDSSRKRLRNLLESQQQTWNCSVWAMRVWRVCTVYGQGSRNISELLLAAQLERRLLTGAADAATASKATRVTDGSSSSNSNSSSSSGISSDRHFVESIARAVGPGMVTRIVSPRRLTEVMWLLEQSAVSCAAVINTHTMKVETREKTPSTTSAVSAANRQRELKEEEAVGIALETARLLLGVAESLLPAVLSWPRLEGNSNTSSSRGNNSSSSSSSSSSSRSLDSFVDADTSLLFSASAHFLSSLLGCWSVPSPSLSRESTQSTGQLARKLLPLRELEGYSLRQHQILRSKQEQEHSVGLGLLQSCLQYAQYVRMATSSESQVTQEVEKKEEKGTSDASAPAGDDTSCERPVDKLQFQFAALHHLESKINSFVDTNISYALLSSLNSMLSTPPDAEDDGAACTYIRCSFSSWIAEEASLSIMRLFSNVVSYIRMKPTPQGKSLSLPFLIIILITSSCLLITVHLTDRYHR